jgi:alkylation response protein AidB-like acyl-CoA dehydrogenase
MYDLHLTAEQQEFRETVRDFVEREIKPFALHPDRLQAFDRPLPLDLLDKVSQLGLRTFALSEESGGAGADTLTSCIVLEELAAGDVDIAAVIAQTATLGPLLFDGAMTAEQRKRFLLHFQSDDRYHVAYTARDPNADIGWNYHRPQVAEPGALPTAVRQASGDWVINGTTGLVANAPIAKLLAVAVRTEAGTSVLLVPRDTTGVTVHEPANTLHQRDGETVIRWYHGSSGEVSFKDCRVPGHHLVSPEGVAILNRVHDAPQWSAVNLGVGRAAYEAAVDYTKIRRQGGRNIVEHQAIGAILADIAIKLDVARNAVWKAAWAADNPSAHDDRSLPALPLGTVARVFTADAIHEATLKAAECFGAMGVMRDMPLQKYVHDALVFLHADNNDCVTKLRIAEAVAGYERPARVPA